MKKNLWRLGAFLEERTHYNDVIMGTIASQITSLSIVYSIVYSDADQRKHQSSTSLTFVRGIHRGPVNSPHKWPVTREMFPFDDVIMHWSKCKLWEKVRHSSHVFTLIICRHGAIWHQWHMGWPDLSDHTMDPLQVVGSTPNLTTGHGNAGGFKKQHSCMHYCYDFFVGIQLLHDKPST